MNKIAKFFHKKLFTQIPSGKSRLFIKYEKLALDIESSAWISASAGGGKTTLIIKRLLKNLIFYSTSKYRVDFYKIFVITYTNEAANEIKTRIKNKLFEWANNEEKLTQDLDFFEVEEYFDDIQIAEIRRNCKNFFQNKVYEQINISTFHSFCFNIIKNFPNELNIDFEKTKIIDEDDASHFLKNQVKSLFFERQITDFYFDNILDIIKSLRKHQAEILLLPREDINKNLKQILSDTIINEENLHEKQNKIEFYKNYLSKKFVLTDEKIHFCNHIALNEIREIDCKIYDKLINIYEKLQSNHDIAKIFQEYCEIFLTKNNTPRTTAAKHEIFKNEQNDIKSHLEELSIIDTSGDSRRIFDIIKTVFENFHQYKTKNHLLDFNDIINHMDFLLSSSEHHDYVLYVLHNKIHNLIVDESQDNSKKQWSIIKIIFDNLFLDPQNQTKNIFIVGDIKQSIYKFQGAEPIFFNEVRNYFEQKSQTYKTNFHFIEWNFSFRVPKNILKYIDNFFNSKNLSIFLACEDNYELKHISLGEKTNGIVENFLEIDDNSEEDDDQVNDFEEKLMKQNDRRIAKILQLIDQETSNNHVDKKIMLLFRSRNSLMRALIEKLELKNTPINYNYRDDLLNNNTAKMILLINDILLNFMDENDDTIDFSDERNLIRLKLFEEIFMVDEDDAKIILPKLINCAKTSSYSFLLQIIISHFQEIFDQNIVKKFLSIAEKLKNQNLNSTRIFVDHIMNNPIEILYEQKNQDSQIFVSTIHGAKGLESDIIIICDDILEKKFHEKFYFNRDENVFLLLRNRNIITDFFKNKIEESEYEENTRLLYVAMTRAKEQLFIV